MSVHNFTLEETQFRRSTSSTMIKFIQIITFILGILVSSKAFPKMETRAVGGEDASPGEFPYLIMLGWQLGESTFPVCHGALVVVNNVQVVVTAATCQKYWRLFATDLVAGELNWEENTVGKQVRFIGSQAIVHERFSYGNGGEGPVEHNIAILTPDYPFELNKNVKPIELPTSDQSASGECVVAGWGTIEEDPEKFREVHPMLQKINVTVVEPDECRRRYEENNAKLPSSPIICAGGNGAGDPCLWDDGAPLVPRNTNHLAGIVSVFTCRGKPIPGAYTDVSNYVEWIEEKVKNF